MGKVFQRIEISMLDCTVFIILARDMHFASNVVRIHAKGMDIDGHSVPDEVHWIALHPVLNHIEIAAREILSRFMGERFDSQDVKNLIRNIRSMLD